MEFKHLRIENPTENWHKVWIDAQGRKLNVLFEEIFDELRFFALQLQSRNDFSPIVLGSAKHKGFVVGADIKRILTIQSDEQIQAFLKYGQDFMNTWENLPNLTIAWIHGPCLGGGLELALACRFRIVDSSVDTQLGMPESKLGLTPGWGGTQRLVRCIGLQPAISMLLDGQPLDASKALELGLADGVWNHQFPVDSQISDWIAKLAIARQTPKNDTCLPLPDLQASQDWIRMQIDRSLETKNLAIHKATLQILRCVSIGLLDGFDMGYRCEREGFFRLLSSPECQTILSRFSKPPQDGPNASGS